MSAVIDKKGTPQLPQGMLGSFDFCGDRQYVSTLVTAAANLNIYGPAHAHDLLEGEYKLSNLGTSFADMETEQRQRLGEQIMMMATLAALPLADAKQYGPGDIAFGNMYTIILKVKARRGISREVISRGNRRRARVTQRVF